nr:hypothetical protein [Micromonospora sp. DSM 115978]
MSRAERLRWRIAHLVERLPGQCWSGLVDWVLDQRPEGRSRGLPWATQRAYRCRDIPPGCDGCYCGKLRRDGAR